MTNPLGSTFGLLIDTTAEAVIALRQAILQEKYKTGRKAGEAKWASSLMRFTKNGIDLAGRAKGVPAEQVRRFAEIPFKFFDKYAGQKKPKKFRI